MGERVSSFRRPRVYREGHPVGRGPAKPALAAKQRDTDRAVIAPMVKAGHQATAGGRPSEHGRERDPAEEMMRKGHIQTHTQERGR